jgi:hypothetical protein
MGWGRRALPVGYIDAPLARGAMPIALELFEETLAGR